MLKPRRSIYWRAGWSSRNSTGANPSGRGLTLLLGNDIGRVYYTKREIQLKKWDEYKFAQGVVILAVNDLLPEDKKYSLSKLALLEAESTVDVSEFKNSRTRLHEGPRN